jgi:hypothetical protein
MLCEVADTITQLIKSKLRKRWHEEVKAVIGRAILDKAQRRSCRKTENDNYKTNEPEISM